MILKSILVFATLAITYQPRVDDEHVVTVNPSPKVRISNPGTCTPPTYEVKKSDINTFIHDIVNQPMRCQTAWTNCCLTGNSLEYKIRFSDHMIMASDSNIGIYYWLSHSSKITCMNKPFKPSIRNHHLLLRILLSNQVELNPGPRTPRRPCGSCGKNVNWKSKAIECDSCSTWYHVDCQGGMKFVMYDILGEASHLSWHCLKCGLPNLSSSYFNETYSLNSHNSFSSLSCSEEEIISPGAPNAASSPIHRPIPSNDQTTTNTKPDKNPKQFKSNRPLKIININFRSIKNKKPELDFLIDSIQPDIIIGTETWLDPSVNSSEYFSPESFTVYRNDRAPNKRGQSHGGVLIAINSNIPSTSIPELQTKCEMVWAEVTISNARKLLICSYYRPEPDDTTSLPLLNESLSRINPNSKSIIVVGGDFNLGYMDWDIPCVITGKPNLEQHKLLLDILNDHSLTQIVNVPTRQGRILDLLLTNYPSIVDKLETIPPIGQADHDIVYTECSTSLRRCQAIPRKVLQFSKANWDQINSDLTQLYEKLILVKDSITTEQLWNEFKTCLTNTLSQNIPEKNLKHKNLPWITNDLRRKINQLKKKMQKCKKSGQKKNNITKTLKSKIQKEQREAYWKYIENMIFNIPVTDSDKTTFTKFPKKLFTYIKTQKTENFSIPPLRKNGLLNNDTYTKSNILNEQFHKEFTPVTDTPIPDKGPSSFHQMKDIDVQVNGIEKLLGNINPHKAKGPDEIHSRVLKECRKVIAPILTIIFQKSLISGKIPTDWKHANVCPVYKKGDKHDPKITGPFL